MNYFKTAISICFTLVAWCTLPAQNHKSFNLKKLYFENKITVKNRKATLISSKHQDYIELDENKDEGLVWINDVNFKTGVIELDIKGQDLLQHSFPGIAFHGKNDTTFEAIYFRPFQFLADDPIRRSRGVQYISLPGNTWQELRKNKPGMYESTINPIPNPNSWFHVKIMVDHENAAVFINNSDLSCLKIPLLAQEGGKIGFYTADRSGGAFSNLKIYPMELANESVSVNTNKGIPENPESWLKFHPTDAGVLQQFVQNKLIANQLKEAQKKINYALKLAPFDHNIILLKHKLLLTQNKKIEASDFLKNTLSADQMPRSAVYDMAHHFYLQKQYSSAILCYHKVINMLPDKGYYYLLACCYALNNEIDHAFIALDVAIQLGENNKSHIETDEDFHNLRTDERWPLLISKLK